jgi:hypothetical protein
MKTGIFIVIITFGMLIQNSTSRKLSLSLNLEKENYSEIEEILMTIDVIDLQSKNEIQPFLLEENYDVIIEFKNNKNYNPDKIDFYVASENRLRDRFDTINIEKLIGKLETGKHSCRVIAKKKFNINDFLTSRRSYSNWISFNIHELDTCITKAMSIDYETIENDSRLLIKSKKEQLNNGYLKYSITNISKDTFIYAQPSNYYRQEYNVINENCEWESKTFTIPGCGTGNRWIENFILPDSTLEINRQIHFGQGVYKLENRISNAKNNGSIVVTTSPIIVNGYKVMSEEAKKNWRYDF